MNLTGSHVAGGSLGAILGVILAALDKKVGLHLTDGEAASFSLALVGIGGGAGHAFAKLSARGVIPTFRRFIFGPSGK